MIHTRYTPNDMDVHPIWLLQQIAGEGSFSVYRRLNHDECLQINDYFGGMVDLPKWLDMA